MFRQNYGRSLLLSGQLQPAFTLLDKEIEASFDDDTERARRLLHLAEWMRRNSRYDQATRYADSADAAFRERLPADHPRLGAVARQRGLILRDQGRLDEAEAQLRMAAKILRGSTNRMSNPLIDVEVHLAELRIARGDSEQARALLDAVAAPLAERFVDGAPLRQLSMRSCANRPAVDDADDVSLARLRNLRRRSAPRPTLPVRGAAHQRGTRTRR